MRCADSRTVKAIIARHILPGMATSRMGGIDLHSHQRSGVIRIMQALDEFGGALLCDEVGLGKTYTAAAVMRQFASSVVVAPAALGPMWSGALDRAGVRARILSVEQFSRSSMESNGVDLVVVDEAHYLRNCATRRFRNLAAFTDRSRTLLLTATPIHNRKDDIIALLSLFLGSAAGSLTPAQLARCVIRRSRKSVADLPVRIHAPAACATISPEIRSRILSLPPPVPACDGEGCATLVQFTLLRQWASSNAALRAGLKMRIGRARALVSALEAGVYPTRSEMTAWLIGSGDVQLAFPSLVAGVGGDSLLLETVKEHEGACVELLSLLTAGGAGDEWRADTISRIRRKYAGRKVVVFTQFSATSRGLFSLLKREPRVAQITSRLCEIASGAVSREYILSRFAPHGGGTSPPVAREDISLLITTDLCSEGLNLQDASVVVHADLPWTAARVEQRIGRVARPGSSHSEVFIHSLCVPEISEDMLRMGARLREKSLLAALLVGSSSPSEQDSRELSIPDANESIQAVLQRWESGDPIHSEEEIVIAGCAARQDCFLGLACDGERKFLLGNVASLTTTDPRIVADIIGSLGDQDIQLYQSEYSGIIAETEEWLRQHRLEMDLGIGISAHPTRKRFARRLEGIATRQPNHERAGKAEQLDMARRAINSSYGAGTEARLTAHLDGSSETDWLRHMATLYKTKAGSNEWSGFGIRALIVGRETP